MLVSDIVQSARDRLGDTDKTGWSDERLIRLVNEGQKDICKLTSIYRNKDYISLANRNTFYVLPEDCFNITRLEYMDEQLPIYSREDIDNSLTVPDVYAIKSNLKKGVLEIVPEFTDLQFFNNYIDGETIEFMFMDGQSVGVVAIGFESDGVCMDSELGVTTLLATQIPEEEREFTEFGDISGYLYEGVMASAMTEFGVYVGTNTLPIGSESPNFSAFGFLTSINHNQVKGIYGVTYGFVLPETHILMYYDAIPPKVTWLGAHVILDDLWLQAMVHYVVGMARQDDNDEGNYKIGELELAKYTTEVAKAKKLSTRDFNSQVSETRQTIYRRF